MEASRQTRNPTTAEAPVNRGTLRRERTRRRILTAARSLIAEKGVDGLRIDQITERANVAMGSYYNHFDSKEQLVEAVVERAIEELLDAITNVSTTLPDPEEASVAPLRQVIRMSTEDPQLAGLLVNLDRADTTFLRAVLPYAVRELERGVREGRFEITDVDVTVTGVIGGMLAVMRRILDGDYPPSAGDAYAEWVLRSFGIAADRAREVATRPLLPSPTATEFGTETGRSA